MGVYRKNPSEQKDYKARFEFDLTTTNSQTGEKNIICQRYFRIGDFNSKCLRSSRVRDAVIRCAKMINRDLIEKSIIYTSYMAPRVFATEQQMLDYFADPKKCADMTPGEGIVISDNDAPNYVWSVNGPRVCPTKFNKYEFAHELTGDDVTTLTFTFKDNGPSKEEKENFKETIGYEYRDRMTPTVCSYTWDIVLPKAVRSSIDLSNRLSKTSPEEAATLNGDAWVAYKMAEGRTDLVWRIIKEICSECCVKSDAYYLEADPFGEETSIQSMMFDV